MSTMYIHTIYQFAPLYTHLVMSVFSLAATECSGPIMISGNSSKPRLLTTGEPIALKPLGDQPTKIILTIYNQHLSNLLLTVAISELAINNQTWQINGKVGAYGRFSNKRNGNNLGFDQDYVKGQWMYLYINLDVKKKDLNVTEVMLKSEEGDTIRTYKTRGLTSNSKAALVVGYKGNKAPFLVAWNCSYINYTFDYSVTTETTTATLEPSTSMAYMQTTYNFPRSTEVDYRNKSYVTTTRYDYVDANSSLSLRKKLMNIDGCHLHNGMPCSSFFFKWVACSIIVLIIVFLLLGITGQFNCYPEPYSASRTNLLQS